ncbi:cation:proton antiporter regulatory subunit [Oleiphilus messinensis]|uniref:cation:proton antiporter regulatory subunit n=1 Tax=Oleiphilus messinensis TaxID=141451 RepID=UPI002FC71C52
MPHESHYIGTTITDSGLPDQDINVLTLYRGNSIIPNPKYSRKLEADDKLLCFGKLENMRKLISKENKRKRSPKVLKLSEQAQTGSETDTDPEDH